MLSPGGAAVLGAGDEDLGWWGRIVSVLPLLVLAIGLVTINAVQNDNFAKELAAIDQIRFPTLPGVVAPQRVHDVFRLDFGPEFRTRGIVTIDPPKMGPAFKILLPQVDADGNDVGGLKTPQVAVPLAVHTGWNLRNPSIG